MASDSGSAGESRGASAAPAPGDSQEIFRQLFENSNDGQYLLDFDSGTFLEANPALLRLLGYSREELVGRLKVPDVVSPEAMRDVARRRERRGEVPAERYHTEIVRKDGARRTVEVSVRLVTTEGRRIIVGSMVDVTDRNAAVTALQESERRLRTVIEGAPIILYALDAEGRFTLLVGKSLEGLGIKAEEQIGRSIFQLFSDAPDIRRRFTEALQGRRESDTIELRSKLFELRQSSIRGDDGRPVGLIGVATDITELRWALKESRKNESKYAYLFQHSYDCVFLVDAEGNILDVNQKVLDQFGYDKDEILSLRVMDLHPPEALQDALPHLERVRSEGRDVFQIAFMKKNGEVFVGEVSATLFEVGGQKIIQGVVRDLTERMRLEEANRTRIQEIIKANARIGILKEKLEKIQDLAARLLNARDEERVFVEAAAFMKDRSKLAYSDVAFYLPRSGRLESILGGGVPDPAGNPNLARVLVGDEKAMVLDDRILAPLKGMDSILGVLEVVPAPKELESLKESPTASRSYLNIVSTLANILGLTLSNLRLYKKVFAESIHDALTHTYNRRYLNEKLEEEVRRAKRYGRPLSILMIDINAFKAVNDSRGHAQGDRLLQEIARALQGTTREVDIVARYGGDEFVIILPETPREAAERKASLLSRLVRETAFTDLATSEKSLRLSISIGVAAVSPDTEPSYEELLREADRGMYEDKRRQKDSN